jgi:hypothetical protein
VADSGVVMSPAIHFGLPGETGEIELVDYAVVP